jgi:hypothetical protein
MRFVCSDPDAGDLEFADIDAVLDALEAALIQPATPLFDAVRQSWQPVGVHAEIRSAWEARLRYRPAAAGLGLPTLPSVTALVRSLPEGGSDGEQRRAAFARLRASAGAPRPAGPSARAGDRGRRYAVLGVTWALLLLAVVGWALVTFAARLSELAAAAVGLRPK